MLTSLRSALARGVMVAGLIAAASPSFAQSPGGTEEDVVVANVNGKPVYRSQLIELFQQQVPPQMQQMGIMPFYDMLVDRLVGFQLLTDEGRAAGLADDPEVTEQMTRIEDSIIRIVHLQRLVEERTTDDKVQAAYEEYVANNPPNEEVKARHILVETEAEAKEIIGLLQAGGDFEALARERSTGPSGPQGGDLGYFARGQMVAEFQDAAFALEAGQFTDAPVKTQFGWRVIKVEDKRMSEPEPLDTIRDQLVEQLRSQIFQEVIAERVASADVERFDIQGNPIPEEPAAPEAPAANQ